MARKPKFEDEFMMAVSQVTSRAEHPEVIRDLDEAKELLAKAAEVIRTLMEVRTAIRLISSLEEPPREAARFFLDA